MFCSKCGKDCGEFKFCPHCGTQVSRVEEAPAVWSVGMACPHCGGVELEGDKCAFCGAVLKEAVLVDADKEWDSYEIPYGEGLSFNQGKELILEKDALLIKKKVFLLSETTRIPYEQLLEAEYSRSGNQGSFTLRWRSEASASSEIVLVTNRVKTCFYYIIYFHILKMLSPSFVKFSVSIPALETKMLESIAKKIDLRELFLRHVPCREPAAEELSSRCMMPLAEAETFISDLFEHWQTDAYAEEPLLAVRDCNRLDRYLEAKYK